MKREMYLKCVLKYEMYVVCVLNIKCMFYMCENIKCEFRAFMVEFASVLYSVSHLHSQSNIVCIIFLHEIIS